MSNSNDWNFSGITDMRIKIADDFGHRICPSCGCEVAANNNHCPVCGYEFPPITLWRKRIVPVLAVLLVIAWLSLFVF